MLWQAFRDGKYRFYPSLKRARQAAPRRAIFALAVTTARTRWRCFGVGGAKL